MSRWSYVSILLFPIVCILVDILSTYWFSISASSFINPLLLVSDDHGSNANSRNPFVSMLGNGTPFATEMGLSCMGFVSGALWKEICFLVNVGNGTLLVWLVFMFLEHDVGAYIILEDWERYIPSERVTVDFSSPDSRSILVRWLTAERTLAIRKVTSTSRPSTREASPWGDWRQEEILLVEGPELPFEILELTRSWFAMWYGRQAER